MWLGLSLLGVLALLYVLALVWIYFQQEKILFYPKPLSADFQFNLPGVEEVTIPVPGAQLSALHFKQPNAKGVIFFLHGNGGNLQDWLLSTDFYRRVGYDLFMLDYRGYGKSTGHIQSEAQLHADVRAAWDVIAPQYAHKKRVIYGRSLGTGLATQLATQVPADLLILVSPYRSVAALAERYYAWAPRAILRYPLPTEQWLGQVAAPVVLVHGRQDQLIPYSHTTALHAIKPASVVIDLSHADHGDVHEFAAYHDGLAQQLARLDR
jgi:alpha-beta hydrolase superfamily lysophospholipase